MFQVFPSECNLAKCNSINRVCTWSTRRTVHAAAVANLIAQCFVTYRSTSCDSTASFTAGKPAYNYTKTLNSTVYTVLSPHSRLHQSTTARHVYYRPQQAAGGTEHTGQGGVSSTMCCQHHRLDWIVQCFTFLPTRYRLYGRRFLQIKRPNQQLSKY